MPCDMASTRGAEALVGKELIAKLDGRKATHGKARGHVRNHVGDVGHGLGESGRDRHGGEQGQ